MTPTAPTDDTVCFVSLPAYGYFVPESDIAPGGAERQLYLLSQELRSVFDVHFVVGDYGQPRTMYRDGVTLHRAYTPSEDPVWQQTAALFRAMRRADADLYVYRGFPRKAAVTYGMARLLGTRWVYNLAADRNVDSHPDQLSLPLSVLFRRSLADADGIIAQTPYQRTRLRERFGVDATVVPNGYPPAEEHTPYGEREHFLWVGRLERAQKRPHLFLQLAEALPDCEFVLAGPDGSSEEYNERIARRASQLDNVTNLGRVDPDRIHERYRRATALVSTSAHEGFPNTFLEAWRYGTPVLSLDIDPARFLRGQEAGFADGEFDTLEGLVRMLDDSVACRREFGRHVREEFEATLTISETAAQYADALRAALR
ncbi:glycosyltransferase family 4 protein [Haloglomus halophilum]|uniref:glycosyltransferase family 4 protein n=1 Tax=Haloglomus halophilum TaxID=2962672 RepID=UPI0020C96388|nr:glycosyltransferase family 4 protein [Haloglomus halophilum]